MYDELYVLSPTTDLETEPSGTDSVKWGIPRTGDAPICSTCGDYVGMLSWLPPYEVELECWGKGFDDLARLGGVDTLVSERVKSLYEAEGLAGWMGFEPVTIRRILRRAGPFKGDPPNYYYVHPVRSRAVIDQVASGFEWTEPPTCPECRQGSDLRRWKRIILEPGSWSAQEDVFIPRGLNVILTSRRFKEFCEKHLITNAVLFPADEHGHDTYPWDNA